MDERYPSVTHQSNLIKSEKRYCGTLFMLDISPFYVLLRFNLLFVVGLLWSGSRIKRKKNSFFLLIVFLLITLFFICVISWSIISIHLIRNFKYQSITKYYCFFIFPRFTQANIKYLLFLTSFLVVLSKNTSKWEVLRKNVILFNRWDP